MRRARDDLVPSAMSDAARSAEGSTTRRRFAWLARPRVRRGLAAAFGLVVLGAFVWAFVGAFRDAEGSVWPSFEALGIAVTLTIVALIPLALAWLAVQPTRADPRRVLSGVWLAQLAKYIPSAGIAHAMAQVGLARSRSTGITQTVVAFPVWFLTVAVANAPIVAILAFDADQPLWVRTLAGLSLLSVVVVWRPWMAWVLSRLGRFSHRVPSHELIPAQGAILRAFGFGIVSAVAYTASFAVVMVDLAPETSFLFAMAAFAAALLIGIAVIPIPAGVGVRELVILYLLGGTAGAAAAASAALFHRLVIMLGEILLVGTDQAGSALWQRLRAGRVAKRADQP